MCHIDRCGNKGGIRNDRTGIGKGSYNAALEKKICRNTGLRKLSRAEMISRPYKIIWDMLQLPLRWMYMVT